MTQEEVHYVNNILDEITKPITTLTVISSCTAIRGVNDGDYAFIKTRETLESCYFETGSKPQNIQTHAFYKCVKLSEIDLSVCNELKYIESYAFESCKSLKSVKFPSSLQRIYSYAFQNTNLSDVIIPSSVTTIYSYAFASITQLKSFTCGENSQLTDLWDHVLVAAKIQSFAIPDKLKSITGNCFDSCLDLINFQINSNTNMKIKDGVVFNSKMTSLLICPPGNNRFIYNS